MIKISEVSKRLIYKDESALFALSQGWLNLSAFALHLRKAVEEEAKKTVRPGSIVVALSRLAKTLKTQKPLLPKIILENLSAKSGLVEVAFNKTPANQKKAAEVYGRNDFLQPGFYTLTQGVNEIALILEQGSVKTILSYFKNEKPKFLLENLAALTVSFGKENIFIPNTTFALIRVLAVERINIIEVVSTFTELSFILEEKNLQRAFGLMSGLMKSAADGRLR